MGFSMADINGDIIVFIVFIVCIVSVCLDVCVDLHSVCSALILNQKIIN